MTAAERPWTAPAWQAHLDGRPADLVAELRDPKPSAPADNRHGWRLWSVSPNGILLSPILMRPAEASGSTIRALCNDARAHTIQECTHGIYYVAGATAFYADVDRYKSAAANPFRPVLYAYVRAGSDAHPSRTDLDPGQQYGIPGSVWRSDEVTILAVIVADRNAVEASERAGRNYGFPVHAGFNLAAMRAVESEYGRPRTTNPASTLFDRQEIHP